MFTSVFVPRRKRLFLLAVFLVAAGIYLGTTRTRVRFFVSLTRKGTQTFQQEPNAVHEAHYYGELSRLEERAGTGDHNSRMFKSPSENVENVTQSSSGAGPPKKTISKEERTNTVENENVVPHGYEETDTIFRDDSTQNTQPADDELITKETLQETPENNGKFPMSNATAKETTKPEIPAWQLPGKPVDDELITKERLQETPENNGKFPMSNVTAKETTKPEIPVWQLPGKSVFQSIKLRDIVYSEQSFPNDSSCPFMGIRRARNDMKQEEVACSTRQVSEKECEESFKAYKLNEKPLTCKKPKDLQTDLCWILDSWRPYAEYKLTVQCEISSCGRNPVIVSGIDPDVGIVQKRSTFQFKTSPELEEFLSSFIITNTRYGLNFCFLGCVKSGRRRTYLSQILTFPPILQDSASNRQGLFNFNVLVLDSVSRRHFYRSLPQAVETLQNIVHSDSVNATAFDFELLQSTAPYTFHNIKVFMSGQSGFEGARGSYGISTLYEKLKRRGYYTVLQEDSCWYDEWGSILTNNIFQRNVPKTEQEFRQSWGNLQNMIRDYHIDDFGLSHSSCEIFKQYKSTNQFNRPRKICFGGTTFAEHFWKYSASVYNGYADSGKRQPIFMYTHLNIGHETTGTRIRQIDEDLSRYLKTMAAEEDTLTLIFSDHGPKTTDYSFKTVDGRAETYDSLLFAIVPQNVANILGAKKMQALVTNQQRLMSTKEIHSSILSIVEPSEGDLYPPAGLFAVVPANRTCAEISMKPTAVCKCGGWEKRFPYNHPQFLWLAEFALGYLNNLIQDNFKTKPNSKGGFGNCQRLVGSEFQKLRRKTSGSNYVVTMDLITQPRNEIFEVQVTYPIHPFGRRDDVTLTSKRRVSIYRRNEKCVDATVPVDLCVCDSKKYGRTINEHNNWEWFSIRQGSDILTSITRMRHFGSETTVKNLHETCLLLLTRNHSSQTSVAFEITNGCGDRRYKVRLNGRSKGRSVTSRKLPLSINLLPRTIHFLFSVYYFERPYGFVLKTSFVAYPQH